MLRFLLLNHFERFGDDIQYYWWYKNKNFSESNIYSIKTDRSHRGKILTQHQINESWLDVTFIFCFDKQSKAIWLMSLLQVRVTHANKLTEKLTFKKQANWSTSANKAEGSKLTANMQRKHIIMRGKCVCVCGTDPFTCSSALWLESEKFHLSSASFRASCKNVHNHFLTLNQPLNNFLFHQLELIFGQGDW